MNIFSAFLRDVEEEDRDVVLEYWQSEHHRFEYGEHYDVMLQLDPLSYHQMPLAVPGSFLQKCKSHKLHKSLDHL